MQKLPKTIKRNKYQRLDLGLQNGIKFILVLPSRWNKDKYPLHYIEYYHKGKQVKYYSKVKELYLKIQPYFKSMPDLAENEKIKELQTIYNHDINQIIIGLDIKLNDTITLNTNMQDVIKLYFIYQQNQFSKGELVTISDYRDRTKKLTLFFSLEQNKYLMVKDLSKDVLENFRDYLLTKKKLANSTVNQYITYVSQLYTYLMVDKQLPVINHTKELRRLDIAKQIPKFNSHDIVLINNLFNTLEENNYTRIHLSMLLIYENTLRPTQVCKIQKKQIEVENNTIRRVYDPKGKRYRSIIISEKAKELLQKIYNNSKDITPDDYLIGGNNKLKKGKNISTKDLNNAYKRFLVKFPIFKTVKLYDIKKSSITQQFEDKNINVDEIRQRAGHSKISTTLIYNHSKDITTPYIFKQDKEVERI